MTLMMEQQQAKLPDSGEAARAILEGARPLRDDPEYQRQFYDEMGVVRTPLVKLDGLSGSPVYAMRECDQDSGSYKRRGATNAVMGTDADVLVAFSTGNHAQAVMRAGHRLGKHVIIEVPRSISEAKEMPLVKGGAELHYNDTFRDAQLAAEAREGEPGVAVIAPFGHDKVVEGQLSVGYELVESLKKMKPGKKVVPVPAAGLGLLLGVTLPIREAQARGELGPDIEIVAVQPENTDAAGRAVAKIQAGEEPVDLFLPGEFDDDCDALAITEDSLNPRNLAVAADTSYVDGFATVDKLRLAQARRYLSDQLGVEVEPAAALPMAYALAHATGEEVFVLPVTGKNISKETRALYDGLVTDEYVRQFRELSAADLELPDRKKDRQLFTGRNAVRGAVLSGSTTREYVGSKPARHRPRPQIESPLEQANRTAVAASLAMRAASGSRR